MSATPENAPVALITGANKGIGPSRRRLCRSGRRAPRRAGQQRRYDRSGAWPARLHRRRHESHPVRGGHAILAFALGAPGAPGGPSGTFADRAGELPW